MNGVKLHVYRCRFGRSPGLVLWFVDRRATELCDVWRLWLN